MYDALMTRLNYWLNLDANEKIKILLERQEMIMKKKEFAPWRKTRSPPPSPANMARNLHVDRTLVWSRSTIEYCSIDSMVLTEMEYVW